MGTQVGAGHGLAGMVMAVVIRSSARLFALFACLELYYDYYYYYYYYM